MDNELEPTYSLQDVRHILKLYPSSLRECVTCEHYEKPVNAWPCQACICSGDFDRQGLSFYTPDIKKVMKFVYTTNHQNGSFFEED